MCGTLPSVELEIFQKAVEYNMVVSLLDGVFLRTCGRLASPVGCCLCTGKRNSRVRTRHNLSLSPAARLSSAHAQTDTTLYDTRVCHTLTHTNTHTDTRRHNSLAGKPVARKNVRWPSWPGWNRPKGTFFFLFSLYLSYSSVSEPDRERERSCSQVSCGNQLSSGSLSLSLSSLAEVFAFLLLLRSGKSSPRD